MTDLPDVAVFLSNFAADHGVEVIPDLLGELERAKAMLLVRLLADRGPRVPREVSTDRLLTAQEVSERTQLSVDWWYKNKTRLPFCRRVGRKVLFSEAGLTKWLATRAP